MGSARRSKSQRRPGGSLTFSFQPSTRADREAPPFWQHVGLYAYRREFLLRFPGLAPTPAEQAEGLEQLRALLTPDQLEALPARSR